MKKILNIITIAFATAALASCCNMHGKGCDVSGKGKAACYEKCEKGCKCPCCKNKDKKIKCGKGKEESK